MFIHQYPAVARRFGQRIRAEGLGRDRVVQLLRAEGPEAWHVGLASVQRFLTWFRAQPVGGPDDPAGPVPAPGPAPVDTGPYRLEQRGDDHAEVSVPLGSRVTTVDELMALARIDERVWKVTRAVVNTYEQGSVPRTTGSDQEGWARPSTAPQITPLYQVKIWLERRVDELELRALHAELLADARTHAPRTAPLPRLQTRREHVLVAGLMDVHVGRLVWEAETGGAAWSTDIARARVLGAVERLAARAERDGVERVILPLGNDLMHVDNPLGTTTAGTRQDVQVRYRHMKRLAYQLMIDTIDTLRHLAPVDIVAVPGNHGRESDMDICERLHAWYHATPDVTVSIDPRPRQYVSYGVNLLGFAHGDREKPAKLPLLMPLEAPEQWAQSLYREFLTGHFHAKGETQFRPLVDHGVTVRIAPSLTSADAWHAQQGYVGSWRSCEGYLYHRADGYAGTLSVSALSLESA